MLQFIAAWFRGEVEQIAFAQGFEDALHPDFLRVQPSGRPINRANMIDALRDANGTSRFFKIQSSDIKLVSATPDISVATYTEYQSGAQNSQLVNVRHAMVVFEHGPRMRWRYVHETALSGGRISAIL